MSQAYGFDGTISRPVLENYLARAITMLGLSDSPQRDEDLRFLRDVGAKYIGRAAYVWGMPGQVIDDEAHFAAAAQTTAAYHRLDAEAIFQACIFEVVFDTIVGHIAVPAWVFEEFSLPVEKRNFNYEAMLFDSACANAQPVPWCPHAGNNWMHDYFGKGASVPDISKREAQMWFYYRARRYIDTGYEALHVGQVHLMANNDPGAAHWFGLLARIRRYAAQRARRHLVLIDAHTHGISREGKLLLDLHSFPLRIRDVVERPEEGVLEAGFTDAIFGKSMGGVAPSGWSCDHLPYIVELDNWSSSGKAGQHLVGGMPWVWGCDEICWFARQSEAYRNNWLRYAHARVRELDPHGYLQMPGYRCLADPVDGVAEYHANTRSPASPTGFNQEATIKALWAGQGP